MKVKEANIAGNFGDMMEDVKAMEAEVGLLLHQPLLCHYVNQKFDLEEEADF